MHCRQGNLTSIFDIISLIHPLLLKLVLVELEKKKTTLLNDFLAVDYDNDKRIEFADIDVTKENHHS